MNKTRKLFVNLPVADLRRTMDFFAQLGYASCAREDVPEAIRASRQFAALGPPTATAMVKRL